MQRFTTIVLALAGLLALLMQPAFGSSVTKTVGASGADYSSMAAALADLNANGVADTVSLMLIDSVYNEPPLSFNPQTSMPTSLYIYQGGTKKPELRVSGGGFPFGLTVRSLGEFVLYNVIVKPDSGVGTSWNAGVNVRSQIAHSRVYIQSGGVIGSTTQFGYHVVADSSSTVQVFGCLVFDVTSMGINIELYPTAGSAPTAGRRSPEGAAGTGAPGFAQVDSCTFSNVPTAAQFSGIGTRMEFSRNTVSGYGTGVNIDPYGGFTGGAEIHHNSFSVSGRAVQSQASVDGYGWVKSTISVTLSGARIHHNTITGGSGISWAMPPIPRLPLWINDNTLTGVTAGIAIEAQNDTTGGLAMDSLNFGQLHVESNAITAGAAIPNFVAMQYRSKRSELPPYNEKITVSNNTVTAGSSLAGSEFSFTGLSASTPVSFTNNHITVDKEVWRQDFGQVKADRHTEVGAAPKAGRRISSSPAPDIQFENNVLSGLSGGVEFTLCNDSTAGVPLASVAFGTISMSHNSVTAVAGIPNFVCMQLRSKRSELPTNVDRIAVNGNTLDGSACDSSIGLSFDGTFNPGEMEIDSNSIHSGDNGVGVFCEVRVEKFHVRQEFGPTQAQKKMSAGSITAGTGIVWQAIPGMGGMSISDMSFTSSKGGIDVEVLNDTVQGPANDPYSVSGLSLVGNQFSGGSAIGAPPYGARLRLKSEFNTATISRIELDGNSFSAAASGLSGSSFVTPDSMLGIDSLILTDNTMAGDVRFNPLATGGAQDITTGGEYIEMSRNTFNGDVAVYTGTPYSYRPSSFSSCSMTSNRFKGGAHIDHAAGRAILLNNVFGQESASESEVGSALTADTGAVVFAGNAFTGMGDGATVDISGFDEATISNNFFASEGGTAAPTASPIPSTDTGGVVMTGNTFFGDASGTTIDISEYDRVTVSNNLFSPNAGATMTGVKAIPAADEGSFVFTGNNLLNLSEGGSLSVEDFNLVMDSNVIAGVPGASPRAGTMTGGVATVNSSAALRSGSGTYANRYEVSVTRGSRTKSAAPVAKPRNVNGSPRTGLGTFANRYEVSVSRGSRTKAAAPVTAPKTVYSALAGGNRYEVSVTRGSRTKLAAPVTSPKTVSGVLAGGNRYEVSVSRGSRTRAAAPAASRRSPNGNETSFAILLGSVSGNSCSYVDGFSLSVQPDSIDDSAYVVLKGNEFSHNGGNGLEVTTTGNTLTRYYGNKAVYNAGGVVFTHSMANGTSAPRQAIRYQGHHMISGVTDQPSPVIMGKSVDESGGGLYDFASIISGNTGDGLRFEGDVVVTGLSYMNISGNGGYNLYNGTPHDIDANYNWWGTTSSSAIAAKIFDHADSGALGTVDYSPFRQDSVTTLSGTITGFVYADANGDSTRNAGEAGLTGWSVQLRQGSTPVDTAVTGSGGSFLFTNLPLDAYNVRLLSQTGFIKTEHAGGKTVHFASDGLETLNFGVFQDQVKFRTFRAGTDLSGKPVKIKFDRKRNMTSSAPNIVTAMENAFARLGKAGAAFLGVPQSSKDSAKVYAWIAYKKAADLGKFYTSAQIGETYPIDSLRPAGKKPTKLKGALKPDRKKYDNILWEQAVIFRLNLIASQLGVTPTGFGALELDTSFTLNGKQLRGKTLAAIADYADSLATYWKRNGITSQAAYDKLGDLAVKIYKRLNEAFAADMDTSNYAIDSTSVIAGDSHLANKKNAFAVTLKGVKTTTDVGIVNYIPGAVAVNAIRVPSIWDGDDQTVDELELPTAFALNQNYPNPFNPTTMVSFDLPSQSLVTLKVYNMLGQEVATLADRVEMEQGRYALPFDASQLASGVYFYRISGSSISEDGVSSQINGVGKMLLVR